MLNEMPSHQAQPLSKETEQKYDMGIERENSRPYAVGFLPNLSLNFGFFSSPPSDGRGLIVPVAVAVPLLFPG
jgi:hypothetical protein